MISIDEKGAVTVYAPFYARQSEINAFVREKAQWILKGVRQAQHRQFLLNQKTFDDGQEFLFLGKKFKLVVTEGFNKRSTVNFDGIKWSVDIPESLGADERRKHIKKKLTQWYREQAKEILGGRIFRYARTLGVEPRKVAIRTQKHLWGNCDFNTQTIHLNWQIILSPLDVVDYVVVHELCHLIVPNHSKRFWRKVEKVLPDFKRQKKWLKMNALDMTLP